jgi:RNA polymerase sigma factor (sigma-70 family)
MITAPTGITAGELAVYAMEHWPQLAGLARRYAPDPDDAEDIAAGVIALLCLRPERILEEGTGLAYLRRAVANAGIDRQRRERKHRHDQLDYNTGVPGPEGGLEAQAAAKERLEAVRQALGRLTPRERRAVGLAAAGMPLGDAKVPLFFARRKLRDAAA